MGIINNVKEVQNMEDDFLSTFGNDFDNIEDDSEIGFIPQPEIIEDPTPKKKRIRDRGNWKHVQGRLTPDEYKKFCIHMANIGVESKAEYIRGIIMKEVNSYGIQFVESDEGVQGTGESDGGNV